MTNPINETMSMNIKDYLKVYDNAIDLKTCKSIVKQLKKADWQMHTYYHPSSQEYKSYEKELSVSWLDTPETKQVQDLVWHVIQRYINDLGPAFHEWYSGWQGYTQLRYNRYDVNTQMKIHCDHIHTIFDGERKGIPTLTVLGGLNEGYEGGDLVLWQTDKIVLKTGSIMIFPSNFLYPHRVDEVTKGTRYSFVSWVW